MLPAMDSAGLLSFPCDYPIKVMLRSGAGLRAQVNAVIARHAGPAAVAAASERPSAQGNFCGLTYTVRARDAQHVAALFAELKDIPGVMMVL